MKFLFRSGLQGGTFAILLTLFIGCQTPSSTSTSNTDSVKQNALRIGVAADLPPLVYQANGELLGMEVELGEGLGEFLSRPVEWVKVPRKQLIGTLETGQCDVLMSGLTIKPSIGVRVNFSNAYLGVGQMALVRSADYNKYIDRYSVLFHTGKVGVVKGSTAESWMPRAIDQATRVRFDTIDDATKDLIKEKVDMVIADSPLVWHQYAKYESEAVGVFPLLLTDEYLGWAVHKESTELLASINRYLDEIRKSGKLNETVMKWIPYAR